MRLGPTADIQLMESVSQMLGIRGAQLRFCLHAAVFLGCVTLALSLASRPANAASASVVVSAYVPSATNLDISACASGGAATAFGTVLPSTSILTAADCSVTFGSSNDTARLRVFQRDHVGTAFNSASLGARNATFGTAGLATVDTGGADLGISGTVAQDGSIYTVGSYNGGDWLIAKLQPSGALDPTFNPTGSPAGTRVVDWGGTDVANDAVVQDDGKLVVVGGCTAATTMCVERFTATGAPDTSFNGTGQLVVPGTNAAWGVDLMRDGRIVVSGRYNTSNDYFSARVLTNGTLDTSYDGDGIAVADFTGGADRGYRVAVQPDGKVLVCGYTTNPPNGQDIGIVRWNTNGSLDSTFGTGGKATITLTVGNDLATSIDVAPDGKIVVGGNGGADSAIVRLLANGTPDPGFGTAGVFMQSMSAGTDRLYAVTAADDGSVYGTGLVAGAGTDMLTLRLTPAGVLDPTFAGSGSGYDVRSNSTGTDEGSGIALVDGGVVIIGYSLGATMDVAVERYDAVSVPDYASGTADWIAGPATFGACLRAIGGGAAVDGTTWGLDPNANCADGNADPWNAIPSSAASTSSSIAVATSSSVAATASLRFGFRAAANQRPGNYTGGLLFEVIAPSV